MDSTSVAGLTVLFASLAGTGSGGVAEGSNDDEMASREGECELAQIAQNASTAPISLTRIECASSALSSSRNGHACVACAKAPKIKTRAQNHLSSPAFRVCVQCSTFGPMLDAGAVGTSNFWRTASRHPFWPCSKRASLPRNGLVSTIGY